MHKSTLYFFPDAPEGPLTFYSPYYGDLPSVAERFFKMHRHLQKEDYGKAFLKANYELDFGSSSIPANYRVILNSRGILSVWSYEALVSQCIFEGPWYTFVNQYGAEESLYCFQIQVRATQTRIMTGTQVQDWIQYLREFPEERDAVERLNQAYFLELQLQRIPEKK
jgi:hypothetical protein